MRFVGLEDGAEPGSQGQEINIERFVMASSIPAEDVSGALIAAASGMVWFPQRLCRLHNVDYS